MRFKATARGTIRVKPWPWLRLISSTQYYIMRDEETNWLGYSIDYRTNNPITLKFEISLDSENDDVSSNKSRKNQAIVVKTGEYVLLVITALQL